MLACLLAVAPLHAAPLRPTGPADICGSVVSHEWRSEHAARDGSGRSGAQQQDYALPAGFRLLLENYRGADAGEARLINSYLGLSDAEALETPNGPRRLRLHVPHADPRFLDGVTSLCVEGFQVGGDERTTWIRYRNLSVTRTPSR